MRSPARQSMRPALRRVGCSRSRVTSSSPPGARIGRRLPIAGTTGYVINSGQPAAIQPSSSDTSNEGVAGLDGSPSSILPAPCDDEDVMGVIELVNKRGEAFNFDDVEIVSLLARVAGGALSELGAQAAVPTPAELARELENLARLDASRYAALARMIQAVLGQS